MSEMDLAGKSTRSNEHHVVPSKNIEFVGCCKVEYDSDEGPEPENVTDHHTQNLWGGERISRDAQCASKEEARFCSNDHVQISAEFLKNKISEVTQLTEDRSENSLSLLTLAKGDLQRDDNRQALPDEVICGITSLPLREATLQRTSKIERKKPPEMVSSREIRQQNSLIEITENASDDKQNICLKELEKSGDTKDPIERKAQYSVGQFSEDTSQVFGVSDELNISMQKNNYSDETKKAIKQDDMDVETESFQFARNSEVFDKKDVLKQFRNKKSEVGNFLEITFEENLTVERLLTGNTEDETRGCTVCGKLFFRRVDLEIHMRKSHTGEKPYVCRECGKSFSHGHHLKDHMRTHTGEKPFTCNVCGKSFNRSISVQHMRTHTGEKPFQCSLCGLSFSRKYHLQQHERIHTGEKPFSCTLCEKSFAKKGCLERHVRTHTEEKPFSCNVCEKSFRTKGEVQRHQTKHTGDRPFMCQICGKLFAQKISLEHMRIHTGEKPFNCTVCKKSFSRKSEIHRHAILHSGKKPFKCKICGKAFSQKITSAHMRTHTGERPYQCTLCGKSFCRGFHLRQHERTHTG